MDIWDVIPFVVGAYYLFGRSKKKSDPDQPAQPAPKKRPEVSLEDVWKQLTSQTSTVEQTIPPPDIIEPRKKIKQTPVVEEKGLQDYSEYQTRKTMRPDSVGHSLGRENLEKKSYVKLKNIAEKYDDPILHSTKKSLHREFDRHLAVDVEVLSAEDIDLRQAIIYDAILNRPKN
jgi:hypothetical protein